METSFLTLIYKEWIVWVVDVTFVVGADVDVDAVSFNILGLINAKYAPYLLV
ncbi:MAG: hypothetical protein K0S01_2953 [Herbinix sp.]|jgi:hypothetical protein|nr:hypothetical protein [Herbinix sp.]